jgi:hypothetical protein
MDDYKIHSRNGTGWVCTHYKGEGTEEFVVPYTVELVPVHIEAVIKGDLVFSTDELPGIFVCNKNDVVWYPVEKVNI